MNKKKKFIKLINNEKVDTKVKQAKACVSGAYDTDDCLELDTAYCSLYAVDNCPKTDYAGCTEGANDYCAEKDHDMCVGANVVDFCITDCETDDLDD